jgi:hypothetical protein
MNQLIIFNHPEKGICLVTPIESQFWTILRIAESITPLDVEFFICTEEDLPKNKVFIKALDLSDKTPSGVGRGYHTVMSEVEAEKLAYREKLRIDEEAKIKATYDLESKQNWD